MNDEETLWRIISDNDGHDYLIPESQSKTFWDWVAVQEGSKEMYDGPDFGNFRMYGPTEFYLPSDLHLIRNRTTGKFSFVCVPQKDTAGVNRMITTRAAFVVTEANENVGGGENICFRAVTDGDDADLNEFAKYTPSGDIRLHIGNEKLFGAFSVGEIYYVDFTPKPCRGAKQ